MEEREVTFLREALGVKDLEERVKQLEGGAVKEPAKEETTTSLFGKKGGE